MDWRGEYERRLTSPEEAVRAVRPGDRVAVPLGSNPQLLGDYLAARVDELQGVEVAHTAVGVPFPWLGEGFEGAFSVVHEHWASPLAWEGMASRRHDYLPLPMSLRFKGGEEGRDRGEARPADVVLLQVSPPDEEGFLNLGPHVWNTPGYIRGARAVIAEVSRKIPRCSGDTSLPVTAFTHLVEYDGPPLLWRPVRVDQAARSIAGYLMEFIGDGDTLQIGAGSTTYAVASCLPLWERSHLGWHSEATPSPVIRLIREGVITGQRKAVNTGKAVSCGYIGTPEDLEFLEGNPSVEVRECRAVIDPRVIAAHENFRAVNAALLVDLTGQAACESIGPRMLGGTGGLLEIIIGALWSPGGRSILLLPSTDREGRRSRIVPLLPEGTVVTVPRTLADVVITEYGVARLWGKTLRQRAEELINIAHPDFRGELRQAARRLLYP